MRLTTVFALVAGILCGVVLAAESPTIPNDPLSCDFVKISGAETTSDCRALVTNAKAWRIWLMWHLPPAEPDTGKVLRNSVVEMLGQALPKLELNLPPDEVAPIQKLWDKAEEIYAVDGDAGQVYHSKLSTGKTAFEREID